MKFREGDSYFVDDNTEITDLFEAPEGANFDSVITKIDGYHPAGEEEKRIFNERSQKGYYILDGEGEISVGEETHEVKQGELVFISEKTEHSLEGKFRALIVTSPPFDPEDEELR